MTWVLLKQRTNKFKEPIIYIYHYRQSNKHNIIHTLQFN
nr:MAG TPA: hypothetical protein [Microviridae sp.]